MLKERENVIVSATEPTGKDREKVWLQNGKNLLNKNVGFTNTYISNTGEILTANNNALFNGYISIKSNTIYTISTNTNISFAFSFYDKNYNFIERDIGTSIKAFSYTSPSNAVYMRIHINMANIITQTIIDGLDIMLEQNAIATTYEPYVEPKMYVLNDNNVYEEFIKKENEIYSTNEQVIGTFLDKTLYRKVINFGALPNAATKSLLHNISNVKYIVHVKGFAKNQYDTDFRNLPFVSATDTRADIQVWTDKSYIYSKTNSDMSTFIAYVVLEYTKTID